MLYKIVTFFIVILLIIGAIIWLSQVHPVLANNNNSGTTNSSNTYVPIPPPSFSLSELTASGTASEEQTTLPTFSGDGVVFIDTADGTPATPYIAYETTKNTLAIKELVFLTNAKGNSVQPCQISAGEYPCVEDEYGDYSAASDVSPVPSGTSVYLEGGFDDQAIIVQRIDTVSDVPTGMVRFATPIGNTSTVSDGVSITPIAVLNDASCTLGVGCFGSNTQRLETVVSEGNGTTTTEIVPGTIFTYGKAEIILLSITGSGSSAIGNFLVSGR